MLASVSCDGVEHADWYLVRGGECYARPRDAVLVRFVDKRRHLFADLDINIDVPITREGLMADSREARGMFALAGCRCGRSRS